MDFASQEVACTIGISKLRRLRSSVTHATQLDGNNIGCSRTRIYLSPGRNRACRRNLNRSIRATPLPLPLSQTPTIPKQQHFIYIIIMFEKTYHLPTLDDAYKPLQPEQLEILHHQLLSEGELISVQSRFNYAWGLIKSNSIEDQRLGIKILTDVFKDSPQRRRECLYYLAIGTFKLGEFKEARRFTETLVSFDPENEQAKVLKKTIEDRITRDGVVGGLMVSGVIAAGVAGLAWFFKQQHNRR